MIKSVNRSAQNHSHRKMTNRKKCFLTPVLLTLVFLGHTVLFSRWEREHDYKISKANQKRINCTKYTQFNESQPLIPNCQLIIDGEEEEICHWIAYHRSAPSDQAFLKSIKENRLSILDHYPRAPNSPEEEEFPIAFSISLHKNVYQFERLLRLIYWPQNLYCIHIDQRAPAETKEAVELLVANFPNIFLTRSEPVYWAGFGVLQAVLNCMNDTLIKFGPNHRWRYFINLAGMDFPLKTNLELIRILKLLHGANDVEFGYEFQFSRYWFSYKSILDQNGYPFTHMPDIKKSKPAAPHHLKIYKGNLAATLSRQFVEYIFNSSISADFIDWLRDTDTADEHLWSSLNYNLVTKAPGSFPADCHNDTDHLEYISRYAVWRGNPIRDADHCTSRYVRDVCIFGVKDVKHLTKPKKKHLFANKFYIDYQTAAFVCMEEWFRWKTSNKIVEVDEDFYSNMPNVIFQKSGKLNLASQICDGGKSRMGIGRSMPADMRILIKGGISEKSVE